MQTLSKNYIPSATEDRWYAHWKKCGYFNSTPDDRSPFTIVMPPPNVTGVLHMGHTLNATVQDILARKARMMGYNVCWVPGSDHASIATEARVVQMLRKEKGLSKKDISREQFLTHAFEWKEKYGNIIYSQIEKLGCSVDWNRTSFTMDEHYSEAVIKVFVHLYEKGLIYRGARMINWDTEAKTALSDEEVEYKDVTGKMYHIKYALAGTDDFLVIATQRPETIMADVAVCAHPDDERYQSLKGKQALIPLINKSIPVIFDEYVEKDFGSGLLKITPAHDINDFNIGLKHKLPVINILDDDGALNKEAQIYVGEDRFAAREKIVDELRQKRLLIKEEEYPTRMGYSQRTQSVVEPRISTQWFVKMKDLAAPALEEVRQQKIQLYPKDKFIATYTYWLENVKDWCISRQLWWGQQIPAWYDAEGNVYVGENEKEVRRKAPDGTVLHRDEDVLDTWFSSWLWPMEVFKGITEPDNRDFNYYYPTSVLVTGQDILFFWVARMIMAGMEMKNKKPFSDVYFTGMVRDHLGRKMSKSLGNSPDLLELIHAYGADAVRFGIMIASPAGNDLLFDENSLEQGKHFNNKLWNALKLIRMWSEKAPSTTESEVAPLPYAIPWFESRLNLSASKILELQEEYRLSEALKILYSLIWDDFCSWYLEWIKPPYGEAISKSTFAYTIQFFDRLLQLLHPYMPFITEDIYHHLGERTDDLMIKPLTPNAEPDQGVLLTGEHLKALISCIREARQKHNIRQKEPISLFIQTTTPENIDRIKGVLMRQVNCNALHLNQQPEGISLQMVCGHEKIFLTTKQKIDMTAQKEKLAKDLDYLKAFLNSVEKKLGNDKFVQQAKPEIIALERKKKTDAEAKIKIIEQSLQALN